MGEPLARDAAIADRVIKHMNADHQDSLVRYLEFFGRLAPSTIHHVTMTNITLDYMIVTSTAGRNIIMFQPPLRAWSEIRQRTIAMDQEALAGLGRSNIVVTEFRPPKGFHALVFVVVLSTLIAFSRRQNFAPGSILYDRLLWHVPAFASFCYTIRPILLTLMICIHVSEATIMDRSRLKRHSVARGSMLWWLWMGSTAIEGYGAFVRFGRIVEREQRQRDKVKH